MLKDSAFVDEVVDLIDGTHWVSGHLETWCPVRIGRDQAVDDVPEDDRLYEVTYRQAGGGDVFRQHTDTLGEAEDLVVRRRAMGYIAEVTPDPMMRKSQWCLVGMVLKVARLPMSESEIVTGDGAVVVEQPWRVIEELATTIAAREGHTTIGWHLVSLVEQWNDSDGRTKEEVREVAAQTADRLRNAGR